MSTTTNQATNRERHVVLDGIFNLRDVGGYPCDGGTVRWRRLFRADGMHRLAGDDIQRVRQLGIRTIIDLRTMTEVAQRGRVPIDAISARYHHLPVIEHIWDAKAYPTVDDAAAFLMDRYIDMLLEGAPSIARALAILAHERAYPVLFHCAAGKDRTGVLAAVILSLLGVPADVVADDYALSPLGMDRMIEWPKANVPGAVDAMGAQP